MEIFLIIKYKNILAFLICRYFLFYFRSKIKILSKFLMNIYYHEFKINLLKFLHYY